MEEPGQPLLTVQVIRTGGFAGLRRQWKVEATSEDEARDWWPLVEACPWDVTTDDGYPDGFVYEVQASDRENDREAVLPEQQIDGPWRELVDAVVHSAS
jgi:hypothetical protein